MDSESQGTRQAPPTHLRLLATTFVIGATSFGGGLLAYVRQVFVVTKGWVDEEAFIEAMEIAEVMPGPNIINLVVLLSDDLLGVSGVLLALLGMVTPAIAANCLLAAVAVHFTHIPLVAALLAGFGASAVGLTAGNVVSMGRIHLRSVLPVAIAVLTAGSILVAHLNLLAAVLLFGVPYVVYVRFRPSGGE